MIYIYSGNSQSIVGSTVRVSGMATDNGSGVKVVSVNGAPCNARQGATTAYEKVITLPSIGRWGVVIVTIDFAGNRREVKFAVTRIK